jgi:hypothetical protein
VCYGFGPHLQPRSAVKAVSSCRTCYLGKITILEGTVIMATATTTGYCMKCKAQREIKSAKQITMKNGRPATEGTCPVCSTKIFKIGAMK